MDVLQRPKAKPRRDLHLVSSVLCRVRCVWLWVWPGTARPLLRDSIDKPGNPRPTDIARHSMGVTVLRFTVYGVAVPVGIGCVALSRQRSDERTQTTTHESVPCAGWPCGKRKRCDHGSSSSSVFWESQPLLAIPLPIKPTNRAREPLRTHRFTGITCLMDSPALPDGVVICAFSVQWPPLVHPASASKDMDAAHGVSTTRL